MDQLLRLRNILARMILTPELAWFAFALSAFDIRIDDAVGTAALMFDPRILRPGIRVSSQFMLDKTDGEVAAVLMHELNHFLQMWLARKGMRDPEHWNIAADGIVNYMVEHDVKNPNNRQWVGSVKLPKEAIILPDDITDDQRYSEWIYDNLKNNQSLKNMMGQIGAGTMKVIDNHSLWGTFNDIPEELIRSQTKEIIENATAGAGVGSTPHGAEEILKLLKEPVVDWRGVLRVFTGTHQRIGKRGTWQRPNRRLGRKQPGRIVQRSGKLVALLDTSGSVSAEELTQFLSEVDYISNTYDVTVIDCDADVQRVYKYKRGQIPSAKGRGGTNMNPGLKRADELMADMLICLTDGGLFEKPIETSAKQLWIITKSGSVDMVKDRNHIKMQG